MKVLMTALLVFAVILSQAQAKDSDLMLKKSFKTSSGTTLSYLLFVPKNYSASQKYPLMVTLRATGSDYIYQVDNNDQAHPWIEDSVQARWPHFFMAPECPGSTWGGMMGAGTSLSPECKAVVEAIEDLKKQYSLDTNRFIIGGFSLGGAGTYHMIKFLPNYWAAAMPVGAGGDSLQFDVASITPTPIWHHQGSNDGSGGPLIRMANALVKNHYPVLRITCDMVVNSPAGWQNEINKGTKPQDIIFKNAKPSYDSISKAVDAGEKYIFQMITNATHEDSRLNANHNPLLAKWALSKVKGGGTSKISLVPISSKLSETMPRQYGTFLAFERPVDLSTGRISTLLGRTCRGHDAGGNFGAQTMLIRCMPAGNSGRQKSIAPNP
jgi:poly(3-hydroxybutyrate) depolymerase